jgi:hypothetical protein
MALPNPVYMLKIDTTFSNAPATTGARVLPVHVFILGSHETANRQKQSLETARFWYSNDHEL